MIAQWEDECTPLSVLSDAWVMLAQLEDECTPQSVLSVAQVMIAQWGNECTPLSVLSVACVMIAQWEDECTPLSVLSLVIFPCLWQSFRVTYWFFTIYGLAWSTTLSMEHHGLARSTTA